MARPRRAHIPCMLGCPSGVRACVHFFGVCSWACSAGRLPVARILAPAICNSTKRPRPRPHLASETRRKLGPQSLVPRSEEHTSELQSPDHLVCRLLLEKKNSFEEASTRFRRCLVAHHSRSRSFKNGTV